MSHEYEIIIDRTAHAIEDAVLVAHSTLVSDVLRDINSLSYLDNVEAKTKGECIAASASVVSYLTNQHSELFSGIATLEAFGGIKDLINTRWMYHHNFLALSKAGTWFAGSPAGYKKEYGPDQRFNRIIESKDLTEVLARITYEDEGLWPTAKYIESEFANNPYRIPRLGSDNSGEEMLLGMHLYNLGGNHENNSTLKPLYPFIDGKIILPTRDDTFVKI